MGTERITETTKIPARPYFSFRATIFLRTGVIFLVGFLDFGFFWYRLSLYVAHFRNKYLPSLLKNKTPTNALIDVTRITSRAEYPAAIINDGVTINFAIDMKIQKTSSPI